MQARIVILPLLDQFKQSQEHSLFIHHFERSFILAAVEEEEGYD